MTMTPEQMLARYESGASLRDIAREDGRTYEGVRQAMFSHPYGADRIAAERGRREDVRRAKKIAERNYRARQRQHDLARLRTVVPAAEEVRPLPESPTGRTRSDRIPDDEILTALREWLLDPEAEGRSPGAYERWRERRGKDTVPSAPTAIGRFGKWSSAKYWALHYDAESA